MVLKSTLKREVEAIGQSLLVVLEPTRHSELRETRSFTPDFVVLMAKPTIPKAKWRLYKAI